MLLIHLKFKIYNLKFPLKIMWNDLLIAVGFLLVLEGIMPFLSPQHWRITMVKLVEHSDQVLRIMGLTSMVIGAIVIYVVRRKLLPF